VGEVQEIAHGRDGFVATAAGEDAVEALSGTLKRQMNSPTSSVIVV